MTGPDSPSPTAPTWYDTPEPDPREAKPWIPHKPEQRFSIVVDRFLGDTLLEPCYFTALHDADGGGRSRLQRIRDGERGQKPGQLDYDVVQGPGLARKLELKRGKNVLSRDQKVTIKKLTECGLPPIVAFDLREVWTRMTAAGFRFSGNVETQLQKHEAALAALDREAAAILSGAVVKPAAKSKGAPRYTAGKRMVKRAGKAGIRF